MTPCEQSLYDHLRTAGATSYEECANAVWVKEWRWPASWKMMLGVMVSRLRKKQDATIINFNSYGYQMQTLRSQTDSAFSRLSRQAKASNRLGLSFVA